jgi:intein/homing endonuclease
MQCCWSHSKINTEAGLKPIKDLDPESDHIKCLGNNSEIITTNKYKVVNSGHKKLLKITLVNGKVLYVTKDHKILTENGYVAAGELTCGHKIAICE